MKIQPRAFYAYKDGDRLELTAPKAYREHIRSAFGDGEEVEIIVQPRKRRRTLPQNAGYHAMISPWADEEGHEIDDLKRDLMGTIFGWSEKLTPLSGQRIPLKPHTSELTVEEFSTLIERTLQLAAECGVLLLAPDEYRQQQTKRDPRVRVAS